jgi:hypothetical protein
MVILPLIINHVNSAPLQQLRIREHAVNESRILDPSAFFEYLGHMIHHGLKKAGCYAQYDLSVYEGCRIVDYIVEKRPQPITS